MRWYTNWFARNRNFRRRTDATPSSNGDSLSETVELIPPRRTMVTRKVLLVVVVLLVAMIGLSDLAIYDIAPHPPTAAKVRAEVKRELAARTQELDRRTCAILATLPRTPRTQKVRHRLRCSQALHPEPTPTATVTVTVPGPRTTKTVTRTAPPKPRRTVTVTPSCPGVETSNGGCVPTKPPTSVPSVRLP